MLVAARKAGMDREAESSALPRLDALPFESEHQYMATLHDQGAGRPRLVFFKGSVESVLERVDKALGPDGAHAVLDAGAIRAEVKSLAQEGMRVLAFACKELPEGVAELRHADVKDGLYSDRKSVV